MPHCQAWLEHHLKDKSHVSSNFSINFIIVSAKSTSKCFHYHYLYLPDVLCESDRSIYSLKFFIFSTLYLMVYSVVFLDVC